MPAPVTFDISLAPLPLNFNGTPQQLATAIAQRLTVTPAEPWSSFQNGGEIPISNVGPVLYEGVEWRVFDEDEGEYTYLRIHGAGIIPGTIPADALAAGGGTPNSFFVYDGSGNASSFGYGASGKYLTMSGASPAWTDLPAAPGESTKYPFRAFPSAGAQIYTAGAGEARITFDAESYDPNGVFSGDVFVAPASGYYHFNASMRTDLDSGSPTTADRYIKIRINGSTHSVAGSPTSSILNGMTLNLSDQFFLNAGDTVDVAIEVTSDVPSTWRIDNYDVWTNFSGVRVST